MPRYVFNNFQRNRRDISVGSTQTTSINLPFYQPTEQKTDTNDSEYLILGRISKNEVPTTSDKETNTDRWVPVTIHVNLSLKCAHMC
jgi:hypothetical protein